MRWMWCAIIAWGVCLSGFAGYSRADERPQPLIVAHRGLLRHAPENTLANFRACLELRLGFEFDVQRTKDGVLVCLHDETVDRTTNGTGAIADLTWHDVRQLDAGNWFDPQFRGERIPSVEQVLTLLVPYRHQDLLIAVDFKGTDVERDVVALAERLQVLDRLLFIGRTITGSSVRDRLKQASPSAQTAVVANQPAEFPQALASRNADWVYFRYLPTPQEIQQARDAGKQAFLAGPTVAGHATENWQHAARVGLSALLTDYPLELRTLLRTTRAD